MRGLVVVACVWSCLWAGAAAAAPCSSVNRQMSLEQQAGDGAAIARQLGVPRVRVVSALRYQAWSVLYVEPANRESVYLFYKGEPARTRYVVLWAGSAAPSEEQEIGAWAVQNAPGIPGALAGCFAWTATHE